MALRRVQVSEIVRVWKGKGKGKGRHFGFWQLVTAIEFN